jgi:hypothetical protein
MLQNSGWIRSKQEEVPVDVDGNPLPWMTYSCIWFLESSLPTGLDILEYGSGYSTLWFSEAKQASHVIAVERKPEWQSIMQRRAGENVDIVRASVDEGYTAVGDGYSRFNVIVNDGVKRPEIAARIPDWITDDGIVIWDDWDGYTDSDAAPLTNRGFRYIEFRGLKPGAAEKNSTAVFYRNENILGI